MTKARELADLGDVVTVDASGNVGIGTSSPATALDVTGTITADGLVVSASVPVIEIASANNQSGRLEFSESGGTIYSIEMNGTSGTSQDFTIYHDVTSASTARFQINQGGDISFYEDTGTTPKFFWDASAESLGIGTVSPAFPIDVVSTGVGSSISSRIHRTDGDISLLRIGNQTSGNASSAPAFGSDTTAAVVYTNNVQRLRIDASGNVGIGTSSPSAKLDVSGSINATANSTFGTALPNAISIGGSSAGFAAVFGTSVNQDVGMSANGTGAVKFYTGANASGLGSASERMRIDSSGNLLIGTTTAAGTLTVAGSARITNATNSGAVNSGYTTGQTISLTTTSVSEGVVYQVFATRHSSASNKTFEMGYVFYSGNGAGTYTQVNAGTGITISVSGSTVSATNTSTAATLYLTFLRLR